MKKIIAAIILSFAAVAQGGTWEYIGHGVYRGDSYYWSAYQKCGQWYYNKLAPVVQLPVVGAPGFWEKMAELNVHADEIADQSNYVRSRWPGRYPIANVETTGFNVLTQGYQPNLVRSGTTVETTGPNNDRVDINAIVHEAQRTLQLAGQNFSEMGAQTNTIVNNAVTGQIQIDTRAAQIKAVGEVVATALMATAPPPSTSTTVFQSHSIPNATSAPTASFQGSGDAVGLLSHGLLMQNCAKCHNQNKLSGGLDLTVDPAQLAPVREKIEAAIRSGKMPAKGPQLSEPVINGILAGIPSQRFAAPGTPPILLPPQEVLPPEPQAQ
jgi:mono/diheme cytochrome c family protein